MTDTKHYADWRWKLRPWTASDSHGWCIDIPGERRLSIDAQSEHSESIAHLIAAAPELLLACEKALVPLTGGEAFFSADDAIAVLRKAIAKAKGL